MNNTVSHLHSSPIEEHLEHNDLNDSYQSAYHRGHSTNAALLKVHSDIAEAIDERSKTTLIMLNLSANFDLINHPTLLKCLEFSFGIKEKALSWAKLYLTDRTQCVSVVDKTPSVGLHFEAPQGSILGPKNYCTYNQLVKLLNSTILSIIVMPMIHKCT